MPLASYSSNWLSFSIYTLIVAQNFLKRRIITIFRLYDGIQRHTADDRPIMFLIVFQVNSSFLSVLLFWLIVSYFARNMKPFANLLVSPIAKIGKQNDLPFSS